MQTFIYTLSDNTGIRYVGKSNDPEKRLSIHLKESKYKRTRKEKWISSLLETGEFPKIEILESVDSSQWSFFESYWISQLSQWGFNLVNGTSGGEGSDGFRGKNHTEESKSKMSKKARGRKPNRQFGESNGRSKITKEIVIAIKKHLEEGKLSYSKIASLYDGVSKTTVSMISLGKRWAHIKI